MVYHVDMADSWKLFLDDLREPDYVGETYLTVRVARSVPEALRLVEELGFPSHIYFDNDLGEELEGYDLAKQLCEMHLDGKLKIPSDFKYMVHSSNPPASANIKAYLESFRKFIENSEVGND